MKKLKTAFALSTLLYATASSALVLDFEGFGLGQIIDDEYFTTFGVTIAATSAVAGSPDVAIVFDSDNPTGGDADLGAPFAPGAGNPFGSISPGNLLILQEDDTCGTDFCTEPNDQGARPAGTISFTFENAVFIESLDFFDIEGTESDIGDVVLFDIAGVEIASFTIPNTGGDNLWQRLLIGVGGVGAIDVNMGGSGALDNLQFAVPLPAGLPLMLGALAMLGFTRRRNA